MSFISKSLGEQICPGWYTSISDRGGVWPSKNHKYFKKLKLDIEFQIFFLFSILLQKIHIDINFVITNMHKIFRQKEIYFLE